jgi:hypothetical protein
MFTHGIQPEDADAVFGDSEQVTKQKEQFVLYVWLNEWKGKQQKGALYFVAGSKHYATLSALLGSDPANHRRVG